MSHGSEADDKVRPSQKGAERGRLLLIIGGGIAAYKSLELIRRLVERGYRVRTILTDSGSAFVTPLSIAALSQDSVHQSLLSLTEESQMGHIELVRWADLSLVAPATANLMARMAAGMADDLATTALLASLRPVLLAPAMNSAMWAHPATRANHQTLSARGIQFVGPAAGDLACGEVGAGRMAEVPDIIAAVEQLNRGARSKVNLAGKRFLVTSGATREAIDPVRYISNHSSGKQGHAIAAALYDAGASVVLVHGSVTVPPPPGVQAIAVTSAAEMLKVCMAQLPVDGAICAAAVADWRVASPAPHKLKKQPNQSSLSLELVQNPDILATLAQHPRRPQLVVGFAAESESLLDNARSKRLAKGCDWIIANPIADDQYPVFGAETNQVTIIAAGSEEALPRLSKAEVAQRITQRIAEFFAAVPGEPS